MEREKTLELEGEEATHQGLPLDEIIDSLGESNHLYGDPEDLPDEELGWRRRRWELIEQEILSRIESEDNGDFTRDISTILSTAEQEEANFQATTEVLITYLTENTDDFHNRLERERIEYRLEKGRRNSGLFAQADSTHHTSVRSIADTADMGVIGLGVIALLFLFTGIAFSGAGITVFGLSLLAFAGKMGGVFAAMGMVLAAIARMASRE